MNDFDVKYSDNDARTGILQTNHGIIETPVFMPVATQASVKSLSSDDLKEIGSQVILSNAYHLYLRPGMEVMEAIGGLHEFMHWDSSILTDSGGFQGFSLEHLRKINEDGIVFKSHIDGSMHHLTPESVIGIQSKLNSDIIMPLDVCLPSDSNEYDVENAINRTFRWLNRSLEAKKTKHQMLFGIVQGGLFEGLREKSAELLKSLNMPGYSIGGLSVGESKKEMYDMVKATASFLPVDKPRYLMGVGSPEDLVECVYRGIDMFDCVLPTRVARNGALFTNYGRINIISAKYKFRDDFIDKDCNCYTCKNFSTAYIHHLFRAKEYLAYRLASIHNLYFLTDLMNKMRLAIIEKRFNSFRQDFLSKYKPADEKARLEQVKKRNRR